jgi:hypothetical protein
MTQVQCQTCGSYMTRRYKSGRYICESCHGRESGRHLDRDDSEQFFRQPTCDRCGEDLQGGRIMSWFTGETICMSCSKVERGIRTTLPRNGSYFEGCGYVPGYGDDRVITPAPDRNDQLRKQTFQDAATKPVPAAVEPAVKVQGVRRVLLTKGDFNE